MDESRIKVVANRGVIERPQRSRDGRKDEGDFLSGEMRDMFMRIRARQDFSIDPFQYPPEPAAVVRCANHQDSARPKDPPHLRPDVRAVRNMLDHFRVDYRGKAASSEREPV